MLAGMSDKNLDIGSVAEKVLADKALLEELLGGLKLKEETVRYNCFKVLYLISQTRGEVLYPAWARFVELLGNDNSYHKMSATHILANLAGVDKENRFEKIFDSYYRLLDDRSMVVAYYIASTSAQIVRAKPALEGAITERLLKLDETHHAPGRKDLIKAGAIEAFAQYFEEASDKAGIMGFVRAQLNSSSAKAKKLAREFLKQRGEG